MPGSPLPFARKELVDEAGIVGAQWWHDGLVHDDVTGRRNLILGLLAGAGLIVGVGALIDMGSHEGTEMRTEDRRSLDMQKSYGWNFGATDVPLVFDPVSAPVPATTWATIVRDMQPDAVHLIPFFVPTLFQSPLAVPELPRLPDEPTFQTLAVELKGLAPTTGTVAKARGEAFARVCALMPTPPNGVAVIVDLPGPDSVAFAAGAASLFTPIFAIDNWPHPRGVVPAHLTLAAVADHHDDLMDAATVRNARPTPRRADDGARSQPARVVRGFDQPVRQSPRRALAERGEPASARDQVYFVHLPIEQLDRRSR